MNNIFVNVEETKNVMEQIEYNLLCMLDVEVRNGILVEKNAPIHIDGKVINYPKKEIDIQDKYSINYEPFSNRKIAYYLFNKYVLLKQFEEPDKSISSFFISKFINNQDYLFASCRYSNGVEISSRLFTNESICWIDLIFIMEHDQINEMHGIDHVINLERIEQQKEREQNKNGRRFK